jgi:3-methyladenine DNA glycosylase Mpg
MAILGEKVFITLGAAAPPPAQEVAPALIGCLLLKRQAGGALLGGVIVETEAYCQSEPACHGHRRRSPSNETLFGEPGHWYVYVSYGIYHFGNVMHHHHHPPISSKAAASSDSETSM